MEKISQHISYYEATHSNTASRNDITNTPTPEVLKAMRNVANACFEPLRVWYGNPISVSSFYRCTLLNDKLKGSKTSQHVKGEAMDITVGSKAGNKLIYEWCEENLVYDQLINEYDYSWVHISLKMADNRNETLIIT